MTNIEALKEVYEEYMNRVFRCSDNYLMTRPKRGREDEFFHYREIAERLLELISEKEGASK